MGKVEEMFVFFPKCSLFSKNGKILGKYKKIQKNT